MAQPLLQFFPVQGEPGQQPWPTQKWPPTYPTPEQPGETIEPPPSTPRDPGSGGEGGDDTLALLLPLLILLTTLLFLLLVFLVFLLLVRRSKRGIYLREEGGPTNLEEEDELEGDGGLDGIEARWLESADEATKAGYLRSKVWQSQYPPNSQPTDITLSQFLSIQEKGVSAWSFEPDYESNPALIVQSRTEITFLSDGVGMAPEEGGGCCVQSNLPLPRLNEVYYWECKMYDKPDGTDVAIGLATKPFPSFRMPGWGKYSVGYFSSDGFKAHSYPFTSTSYGPPLTEGDVLGVGYRPRTGTVFFTRNGKKLEDAFVGLNKHNLFPTVGANNACTVHVNLGQAGFVFIEANVKKWGLAPMMGTLAPPPAYGSERGSILLETAAHVNGSSTSSRPAPAPPSRQTRRSNRPPVPASQLPPIVPTSTSPAGAVSALASPNTQPLRPSPLRHAHSRQTSTLSSRSIPPPSSSASSTSPTGDDMEDGTGDARSPRNPPTPGLFDVSLQSLHRFPQEVLRSDDEEEGSEEGSEGSASSSRSGGSRETERERERERAPLVGLNLGNVEPPAYFPVDPNRYPAGVAEAMLSDVFTAPSSRLFVPPSFHQQLMGGSGFETPGGQYEASSALEAGNASGGGTDGRSAGGWWNWVTGGRGSTSTGASGRQGDGEGLDSIFPGAGRRQQGRGNAPGGTR